jgi:hypothetical protein
MTALIVTAVQFILIIWLLNSLDCYTFKPIYKGSPSIKCPYCSSVYEPSYKGKVCATCNISSVRRLYSLCHSDVLIGVLVSISHTIEE